MAAATLGPGKSLIKADYQRAKRSQDILQSLRM
jgi:hypothetical protein